MVFSNEDKIVIQNDYEEKNWSVYKIWKNHPFKKWDYPSVKHLLKNSEKTGSKDWRDGSGWLRTVSTEENVDLIEELVCSKERQPHTHLAPVKIAKETGISPSSNGEKKKPFNQVQALENTTNERRYSKQRRKPIWLP